MKPTTVTPDDLFRSQRRYIIPLFQRGYVWNEIDQWGPLWRDLVVQTRKVEKADLEGGHAEHVQRHFLGAIVLEPKAARVRHVTDHAVVDGQQRVTTLQIVLIALRDLVAATEDADLRRDLTLFTTNEGQWASDEERFKLWPTNVGRAAWKNVVEAGSAEEVQKRFPLQKEKVKRKNRWVRQPLAEAYLYFHRQIAAYLHGGPGVVDDDESDGATGISAQPRASGSEAPALDVNRAKYLLEAITKYVHVVAIELEPTDDPQVIFETLNGRMAPLTPADLIRNFVFIASVRRGQDTEQLYNTTWSIFDHDPGTLPDVPGFWRGFQKQGRRFHSRLDLFVFHYLTMRTGREMSLTRLFQGFRSWWENGTTEGDGSGSAKGEEGRDPKRELERMVAVAAHMRTLLEPSDARADVLARLAKSLQILDTTTPFPLLLYLAERREEMGEDQFAGCLADIESFLVRRAICDLTTKNYNQIFLRVLGAVSAQPSPSRARLRDYLLTLEGDASRWPTDAELEKGFLITPVYRSLGPARTQMILQELERAHFTGREEGIVVPWATIEHVMPQNPTSTNDWPYASGNEIPTTEELQLRQNQRETLGNLTLVSQPLNSSLSNGPFQAKKLKLADESQLRMNRFFATFPKDHWLEREIAERGAMLCRKAVTIWRRPDNPSPTP